MRVFVSHDGCREKESLSGHYEWFESTDGSFLGIAPGPVCEMELRDRPVSLLLLRRIGERHEKGECGCRVKKG